MIFAYWLSNTHFFPLQRGFHIIKKKKNLPVEQIIFLFLSNRTKIENLENTQRQYSLHLTKDLTQEHLDHLITSQIENGCTVFKENFNIWGFAQAGFVENISNYFKAEADWDVSQYSRTQQKTLIWAM